MIVCRNVDESIEQVIDLKFTVLVYSKWKNIFTYVYQFCLWLFVEVWMKILNNGNRLEIIAF